MRYYIRNSIQRSENCPVPQRQENCHSNNKLTTKVAKPRQQRKASLSADRSHYYSTAVVQYHVEALRKKKKALPTEKKNCKEKTTSKNQITLTFNTSREKMDEFTGIRIQAAFYSHDIKYI